MIYLPSQIIVFFILLLLSFLIICIEPGRWFIYFNFKYSFKRLFIIFGSVISVSYLFPFKLGLPLRYYFLNKFLEVKFAHVTSLMAVESFGSILLWGTSALLSNQLSLAHYENSNWLIFAEVSILFLVFMLLMTIYFGKALDGKIGAWIGQRWNLVSKFNFPQYVTISIVFLSEIFLQVARHFLIFSMLGFELTLGHCFGITTISIFAGLLSMAPLGLGGYDIVIVAITTSMGFDLKQALLVPLINRVTMSFAVGLVGIICFWSLKLSFSSIISIVNNRKFIHSTKL